jgi:hypothetical protein
MTFFKIFIRHFFHFINRMHSDHILYDVQIDSCHTKNVLFISLIVKLSFEQKFKPDPRVGVRSS